MDFKDASGRLMDLGVSLREMAEHMGVSRSALNQARLDPKATGYRTPPDNWRTKLAELARARGGELVGVADEIEGDS